MIPARVSLPQCLSYLLAPLLAMSLAGASAAQTPAPPSGDKLARTDRYGDPLPPGAIARIGTARLRHNGVIDSVSYSPDGKVLASIGGDGIRLWDAQTGKQLHHIKCYGYKGFFSPDGQRVWVQCSTLLPNPPGNEILYWQLTPTPETRLRKASFQGKWLDPLAASPDGKSLAIGVGEGIRICDIATGKEIGNLLEVWSPLRAQYSADGKVLAAQGRESITLWDVQRGKLLLSFPPRPQAPQPPRKFRMPKPPPRPGQPPVYDTFALAPDGKTFAVLSVGPQSTLRLWDIPTGKERKGPPLPDPAPLAVIFSPDSQRLIAASSKSLLAWQFPSGKIIWEQPWERPGGDQFRTWTFSPDGKTLAAVYSGELRLFDATTGRERLLSREYQERFRFAKLLADGRTVVTAAPGYALRFWRLPNGEEIPPTPGQKRLAVPLVEDVSPDGKWLASSSNDLQDGDIRIWDIASAKRIHRLPHPRTPACAFSPDGRWLQAHQIEQIPNTQQWESVLRFWDTRTGKLVNELRGKQGGYALFSRDSRLYASQGVHNFLYRVAMVPDGSLVRSIDVGRSFGRLSFSPDGRLLAGAVPGREPPRLWETATGKEIDTFAGKARKRSYLAEVAFSPDGRTLITSDNGGNVFCWDVEGRLLRQWKGENSSAWILGLTADGKMLVTRGASTILVWSMNELLPPRKRSAKPLTDADLDSLWSDLKHEDATRAYHAVWKLADTPAQAVRFLRQHLRSARQADRMNTAGIGELIGDLDKDTFAVREKASRELAAFGREAEPALRKALAGDPSAEKKRRIEDLLGKLSEEVPAPPPEQLRALRALAVLEYAAIAAARELLKELSQGHAQARLTREANESLQRLLRRAAKP